MHFQLSFLPLPTFLQSSSHRIFCEDSLSLTTHVNTTSRYLSPSWHPSTQVQRLNIRLWQNLEEWGISLMRSTIFKTTLINARESTTGCQNFTACSLVLFGCVFLDVQQCEVVLFWFALGCWLSREARFLQDTDKLQHSRLVTEVTMALLECPPPWNSMVPKASVGLSCVCLLIDHFSDRLSFLAKRSALSFWLDEMPGGRPTCWPIRRPQQHLDQWRK